MRSVGQLGTHTRVAAPVVPHVARRRFCTCAAPHPRWRHQLAGYPNLPHTTLLPLISFQRAVLGGSILNQFQPSVEPEKKTHKSPAHCLRPPPPSHPTPPTIPQASPGTLSSRSSHVQKYKAASINSTNRYFDIPTSQHP